MSKLIEQEDLSYGANNDSFDTKKHKMFTTTEGEFTIEFIDELHSLVGVDAVSEFYNQLCEEQPERIDEYKKSII